VKPIPGVKLTAKYSAVSRDEGSDRKLGGQIDCSF
jgi:hypothetical protein